MCITLFYICNYFSFIHEIFISTQEIAKVEQIKPPFNQMYLTQTPALAERPVFDVLFTQCMVVLPPPWNLYIFQLFSVSFIVLQIILAILSIANLRMWYVFWSDGTRFCKTLVVLMKRKQQFQLLR